MTGVEPRGGWDSCQTHGVILVVLARGVSQDSQPGAPAPVWSEAPGSISQPHQLPLVYSCGLALTAVLHRPPRSLLST